MAELQPTNLPEGFAHGPNGRALTNSKAPYRVLSEEKFWHNGAALMFARGAVTAKEVAEAFDVTLPTIYNLMRQDWFQKEVTRLQAEAGGTDVMALFRAESLNSLVTLVEIRDNPKAPATVRVASARDILDRAHGKALQRIEDTRPPTSSDPVGEVQRLRAENERLEKQA